MRRPWPALGRSVKRGGRSEVYFLQDFSPSRSTNFSFLLYVPQAPAILDPFHFNTIIIFEEFTPVHSHVCPYLVHRTCYWLTLCGQLDLWYRATDHYGGTNFIFNTLNTWGLWTFETLVHPYQTTRRHKTKPLNTTGLRFVYFLFWGNCSTQTEVTQFVAFWSRQNRSCTWR